MVSTLIFRLSSLGSSPSWGHCVVFLGKTLYCHSDECLSPLRCISGYQSANLMLGGNPVMD